MNAHALNLDAELAADTEFQKNETRDLASGAGRALRVDSYTAQLPKAQRKSIAKVASLAKRAVRISEEGDHQAAARIALKALDLAPDLALTNHVMGLMLLRLGRLSRSLEFFEKAWKIDPNDFEIYQKLGLVAWKLDMLEAAEKFYRIQCKMAPERVDGTINLSGVLRDLGKFEEAIEILRIALYAHPEDYELWNSLGTVLMDSGDPVEAATFYQETLRLKPDFSRGHNNMANVYELLGEPEKSIPHFDEALKNPSDEADRATMSHGRSMVMLACGRVADGWDANEARLDPNRAQSTLFTINAPFWDGADPSQLRGKTVIMIGEQGLGDEVLFMNTVKDMIAAVGPEGELRIACEYRLMDLVKRSFPEASVFHHMSATIEGRDVRVTPRIDKDADFWTPMATPLRSFRRSLEDFPPEHGFLKADPELVTAFKAQLDGFGPGPKIGILWKSLKMNARRARFFSAFDAWEPVLTLPGAQFVNLQYGEVDDEIAYAKKKFGVTIHQPDDIDLKMDLDKVAALSSSCDLVLGPMNATSNLAAACGGRVWFIHARSSAWTLLGSDRQHWYPQTRSYFGSGFQDWANTMGRVAKDLQTVIAEHG
jgi:tetratricopeptide (TPR) repeat protein